VIGHLLWFAGIHGAAIVSGMLQMFWLTNLGEPDRAGRQPASAAYLYGGVLDVLYRDWRVGRHDGAGDLLSAQPLSAFALYRPFERGTSFFNINEPVIFGTPIVMNPVFFIPFLLAPMVNAVLAWAAMKLDLIGRVISVVPGRHRRR
jgi:PTS system cellobiose-specific IIC component